MAVELILQIAVKADFFLQLLDVGFQYLGFSGSDILRPFYKADASKGILDCHIGCVVKKPVFVFLAEGFVVFVFFDFTSLVCGSKELKASFVDFTVVYVAFVVSKVYQVTLFCCEKSFFNELG